MAYDFSTLTKNLAEAREWLSKEYQGIRTGRAAPALLDSVMVPVYGSAMPIAQVASVSIEDARTLRISPWDSSTIKAIEKAIIDAGTGLSPTVDEKGLRVSFPELTSERRTQLVKLTREKLEDARVTVRKAREDAWNAIQKRERDGEMGEDDKFRAKETMQKAIDAANVELEALAAKKETELNS